MTEWISIKDKWPDDSVTVLVLSKFGHVTDAKLYRHDNGVITFDPFGYVPFSDVEYWMPLPEPPKESNK